MRYPKDHGQQTRKRIVENASYGLCQNGAHALSVVDLMKLADLTHGSFTPTLSHVTLWPLKRSLWPWTEPSPIGWISRRDCLRERIRRRRRGLSEPSPSQQS